MPARRALDLLEVRLDLADRHGGELAEELEDLEVLPRGGGVLHEIDVVVALEARRELARRVGEEVGGGVGDVLLWCVGSSPRVEVVAAHRDADDFVEVDADVEAREAQEDGDPRQYRAPHR